MPSKSKKKSSDDDDLDWGYSTPEPRREGFYCTSCSWNSWDRPCPEHGDPKRKEHLLSPSPASDDRSIYLPFVHPAVAAAEILAEDREDEPLLPAELEEAAREFTKHAISDNTKRAYLADAKKFSTWCEGAKMQSLPASVATLRGYVTHLATTPTGQTRKPTRPVSIGRALAAIAWFHENHGFQDYAATRAANLRLLLKGVRRTLKARKKGKEPLLLEEVAEAARKLPRSPRGLRDRALLLLGFSAALRRSEITSLLVSDLEFTSEGLRVWFGRLEARATKGDQEGEGAETVSIPRAPGLGAECPVQAVQGWLEELVDQRPSPDATCSICKGAARDWAKADDRCHRTEDCPTARWIGTPSDGPLFRPIARSGAVLARGLGDDAVVSIVKSAAKSVGKNPTAYAGHSLRAGCATSMAIHGVAIDQIRTHLRQKSHQTTMGYIRRALSFSDSGLSRMWASAKEKTRT